MLKKMVLGLCSVLLVFGAAGCGGSEGEAARTNALEEADSRPGRGLSRGEREQLEEARQEAQQAQEAGATE
ncbi:MAG: hypothetical protein KJ060_06285 [Candidatus Hydrogenedentes bacterium]|nr:hypothetical protein [Candidatus Hydrogenedentota bacterium]